MWNVFERGRPLARFSQMGLSRHVLLLWPWACLDFRLSFFVSHFKEVESSEPQLACYDLLPRALIAFDRWHGTCLEVGRVRHSKRPWNHQTANGMERASSCLRSSPGSCNPKTSKDACQCVPSHGLQKIHTWAPNIMESCRSFLWSYSKRQFLSAVCCMCTGNIGRAVVQKSTLCNPKTS